MSGYEVARASRWKTAAKAFFRSHRLRDAACYGLDVYADMARRRLARLERAEARAVALEFENERLRARCESMRCDQEAYAVAAARAEAAEANLSLWKGKEVDLRRMTKLRDGWAAEAREWRELVWSVRKALGIDPDGPGESDAALSLKARVERAETALRNLLDAAAPVHDAFFAGGVTRDRIDSLGVAIERATAVVEPDEADTGETAPPEPGDDDPIVMALRALPTNGAPNGWQKRVLKAIEEEERTK